MGKIDFDAKCCVTDEIFSDTDPKSRHIMYAQTKGVLSLVNIIK